MNNKIKINGKEYILASSIKNYEPAKKNNKGLTYSVIRTYSAGVWAGYVNLKKTGKERTIYTARRLWSWRGAKTLSEMAMEGTTKPNECNFAVPVNEVQLTDVLEVIPATKKAKQIIENVKKWE